jgi:hypothetical protein
MPRDRTLEFKVGCSTIMTVGEQVQWCEEMLDLLNVSCLAAYRDVVDTLTDSK